MTTNKTMVCWL